MIDFGRGKIFYPIIFKQMSRLSTFPGPASKLCFDGIVDFHKFDHRWILSLTSYINHHNESGETMGYHRTTEHYGHMLRLFCYRCIKV